MPPALNLHASCLDTDPQQWFQIWNLIWPHWPTLKMLGPYLNTHIIIHKFCSMFSIMNELPVMNIAKGIGKLHDNVLWLKKKNNNKTKKQTKKSLPEPGIEPGTSGTAVWWVASRPLRQLNGTINVHLQSYYLFVASLLV